MLRFFNTLKRKIEDFAPLDPPKVRMYTCGPTVYSSQHIGNMRAYVTWDILRRVLEFNGYQVNHVMNITDVGHLFEEGEEGRIGQDKLEYEAARVGKSAWDIANYYTDEFLHFMDELNIKKPTLLVKATDHINEMIALIKRLEEKGFTYKISDGVYFDTSKFPNYGELAGGKEGIRPGVRVEMVPGKKNPTDFSLWKFTPKGFKRQMEWDSPWAPRQARGKVKGFPGWHIECSAMSMKYLGESFDPFGKASVESAETLRIDGEHYRTIDIHTGGVDHIPVHHTNEIAQSEAATGLKFVRFWLHNEFVLVDGKRMGKSLGNVFTVDDVKKRGFNSLSLRYLFLTAHYRDKLNFTWESLQAAQNAYNRLVEALSGFQREDQSIVSRSGIPLRGKKYRTAFFNRMNNDLSTPNALPVVWEMLKSNIPAKDKSDLLLSFDEVLGLGLEKQVNKKEPEIPEGVIRLIKEREKLRKKEEWAKADELRERIERMGYFVEDTIEGSKTKKKKMLPT